MILRYGGYSHAQDECEIVMTKQRVYAQGSAVVEHELVRWMIEGEVQGATSAAIVAAFTALERAYANDGGDLKLYFNDGTTLAHQLLNASSYTGVRIVEPPNYPIGDGTELHNARSYRIVAEAEVPPSNIGSGIMMFSEQVSLEGGGPELAVVPLLRGAVQIQTVYQQTEFLGYQEGTIVGRDRYPIVPGPLLPGLEWRRRRRITYASPRLRNFRPLRYTEYRVEYSYTFLSSLPFSMRPHVQTS